VARYEKPNVAVLSTKGQVVIPQAIRRKLGIRAKTKLIVYGYRDAVIMKKLEVPDVVKKLQEIYKKVDAKIAKYGELTNEEIEAIIRRHRARSSQ
jgi:AbrB family looped-hinge helix DNA binding protein